MKGIREKYSFHWQDKQFRISLSYGVLALLLCLVANYFAALYATDRASNAVTDIILSNIPVFNVDIFFVLGPIIFWAIVIVYLLREPKMIPFASKSIALFVITRSIFITLTHIGPFPDRTSMIQLSPGLLHIFNITPNMFLFSSGGDLFFSGHTGLPFLMALVLWHHKGMRTFCLISTVFFGIIVLLGHLHYSIDVLAAVYITYTIYVMATKFFKKDISLFQAAK